MKKTLLVMGLLAGAFSVINVMPNQCAAAAMEGAFLLKKCTGTQPISVKTYNDQVEKINETLTRLRQNRSQLKSDLNVERKKVKELGKALGDLTQKSRDANTLLKENLETARKQLSHDLTRIRELDEKLTNSARDLEESQNEVKNLTEKLSKSEENVRDLTERLNKSEENVRNLEVQLNEVKGELEIAQETVKEYTPQDLSLDLLDSIRKKASSDEIDDEIESTIGRDEVDALIREADNFNKSKTLRRPRALERSFSSGDILSVKMGG